MFENIIVDQNSHWNGDMYEPTIPRHKIEILKQYIDARHIISISGVRRCGKSTLLRQAINYLIGKEDVAPKNILFLNLENPHFTPYRKDVRNLEIIYEDYLKLVDPKGKIYVFLDELQYFSDWQVFVKSKYESGNIKFIITGSNSQLLSSDLITLLSGRTLPVLLFPFDFNEYLMARGESVASDIEALGKRHKLRKLCDEYLAEGGFPEVVLTGNKNLKKEILVNYARNIIYQDIVPRFELKKPYEVEKLFFYLVSNISRLFTFNNLARLMDLSDKTIKDYIRFFEDAFLLYSMDGYNFSVKKQLRGPKKIYCVDNGLIASVAFSFSKNSGHYLENMIFINFALNKKKIYYYKTKNGLEVDFFIPETGGGGQLVQVCSDLHDINTKEREIKALCVAANELNIEQGIIVTIDEEEEIIAHGKVIKIIPAWKFLRLLSSDINENGNFF